MQNTTQKWIPELGQGDGPLYLAICTAIRRDIQQGRLGKGDRLPPQRELAEALNIDPGTVTRAYSEARRQGLIDAEGRRGSFVRDQGSAATAGDVAPFDTGMNLPPIPVGSTFSASFVTALQTVLQSPAAASRMQYLPAGGAPEDRAAGAQWLAARGIDASEDNVLVTSGAQTALHAIGSSILEDGDIVCTGPFVYPGWAAICRRRNVTLLPIAADDEGVDPDAFARACATAKIRAIYLVPDNENPTTATLAQDRRRRIVELARRHDVLIIEDDPYSQLGGQAIPLMASLAPERTWHIGSLSKLVSPALRIAYLRAPLLRDTLRLVADTHETTIMPPPLNLAVCTQWLGDGTWAKLLGEVREECLARQAIVRECLPHGCYHSASAGYHLWIPLDNATHPFELESRLRPLGVSVVSSEQFRVGAADGRRAVRLSIGGGLDRGRLERALRLLDAVLHHRAGRTSPLV